MRIAVTGTQGQLVRCLMDQAALLSDVTLVAIGRPALDLADGAAVEAALTATEADLIINAAAYTAVDQAESESDQAHAINRDGAAHVARAANAMAVPVIQVSTDYVFDGTIIPAPYAPERRDRDRVLLFYGRNSKLAGEIAVRPRNSRRHIIVPPSRPGFTAPTAKNFVKTMLRLARRSRMKLGVVDESVGNPTSDPHTSPRPSVGIAPPPRQQPGFKGWGTSITSGRDRVMPRLADLASACACGKRPPLAARCPCERAIPALQVYKTPAPRPAEFQARLRAARARSFGYTAQEPGALSGLPAFGRFAESGTQAAD